MTLAIRPHAPPAATPVKQPKLDWTSIHALNEAIVTAHERYCRFPKPRPMSSGEQALNAVVAAFEGERHVIPVMHQDADGAFVRVELVLEGRVIGDVEVK